MIKLYCFQSSLVILIQKGGGFMLNNSEFFFLKFQPLLNKFHIRHQSPRRHLTISYIEPTPNAEGFYRSLSGYNYSFVFKYEKKFFNEEYNNVSMERMSKNFYTMVFCAFVYLVVIFSAQKYMKNREKFELRRALIAWNFVLAGFSTLGAIRVWPEFLYVIQTKGIEHSYCSRDWQYGVTGGWGGLFIISKFPEFIDTVFIVARKQKLIFLHWYHHCSVNFFCYFFKSDL